MPRPDHSRRLITALGAVEEAKAAANIAALYAQEQEIALENAVFHARQNGGTYESIRAATGFSHNKITRIVRERT